MRALLGALPSNPFYARKLAGPGLAGTTGLASLDDFFARCPFTTKQELVEDQRDNPVFGTNLTFPLERYCRYHQTSGSTGAPIRWLDTPESWSWAVGNWERLYRAADVTMADHIFFAFSFGPFLGFWTAFEAATRIGCLCLPGGGLNSLARLRMILDVNANVLCCTPTYALRLAEVAAEEKLDLTRSKVRLVMVAGEPGGSVPAMRERLSRAWNGARIFDHHGMTEVGPVSFQCPAKPGVLHIIEESFIPEIIDPVSGRHVATGEQGELVLTNLGRVGSPLLRYRTGDLVRAAPAPCACGRHDLALVGGILGRTDDMVVIRGVNVYPSAVEEIIRSTGAVAEFRAIISQAHALSELRVEIEPLPTTKDSPAIARHLEEIFEAALFLRVPVTIVPPGSLPRFEMKARRWIRS